MLFYLLLCVISILAGQGILRLIGIQMERRISLYLAPVITLAFWATMLGVGVSFGLPVKYLSVIGWPLTIVMVFIGATRQGYHFIRSEWPLLLVVVFLPIGVMVVYFWHGIVTYLGSPHPDGWSYIAYGQYLWEYPRGTEGGLAPLYQYAAHLSRTRFISSALLGFFSPIVSYAGDTQAASGYFLAWAIFVFSSTCMFFAIMKITKTELILFYMTTNICSGWLLNLLWANNFDNALAIAFLPAFAGVLSIADPSNRRWCPILALLAAGILYCYPEMAVFVLGGALLFLLQRLSSRGRSIKEWSIVLLAVVSIVAILVTPFVKDMIWFILNQSNVLALKDGDRPGGNFPPELLMPNYQLMAFWGFGGDRFVGTKLTSGSWYYIQGLLAFFLSLLSWLGLSELFRRREWGLATTIILLLISSLIMLLYFSYPYGTYKLILINWWGISFTIVAGVQLLLRKSHTRKYTRCFTIFICSLFMLFFFINGLNIISFGKIFSQKSILPYKNVIETKRIIEGDPVIVSVNDDLANEWSVYFLRDIPIYLSEYRSYMAQPHVIPYMQRAQKVDFSTVRYLLTDSRSLLLFPPAILVWSGEPYTLWKLSSGHWIFLSRIQNPNGIEYWGGEQAFWLGKGDTEIHLVAAMDDTVVIGGDFIRSPSLPEKVDRQILIFTDQGYHSTIAIAEDGPQRLSVPVVAGQNRIVLRPLDKPCIAVLPYGEPRPLLLGVRGLRISLQAHDG